MGSWINKKVEQAKSLLYSLRAYASFTPFFLLMVNVPVYVQYYRIAWRYYIEGIPVRMFVFPEWFHYNHGHLGHYFSSCGAFLFFMTTCSKDWRLISKIALAGLWFLWALGCIRWMYDLSQDIYMISMCLVAYTAVIVFIIWNMIKLNR